MATISGSDRMLDCVIDLSHWQNIEAHASGSSGAFNEAWHGGITGVILKATQGLRGLDPTYAARDRALTQLPLLRGAYHFGTGDADGAAQAERFLAVVDQSVPLLVLDWEKNPHGPDMTKDQAEAFVAHLRFRTDRQIVLYGSAWWLEQQSDLGCLLDCPLWIAEYGPAPRVPAGWNSWALWQYDDGSHGASPVPGIGRCDRSQFNGDEAAFRAFWHAPPVG